MSEENIIKDALLGSNEAKTKLISNYDYVFRICALRFCIENNFEDFVQEGILSLLERSIHQYSGKENFLDIVIRNCIRYQLKHYLHFYKNTYRIFEEDNLLDKYKLSFSLFGSTFNKENIYLTDYKETKELCLSIVDSINEPLKTILKLLYRL